MNASKPVVGLIALAFALGAVGSLSARAQSDQDHNAHHPTEAPPQTASAMPRPQGGGVSGMDGRGMPMRAMPGGMAAMMGGDMPQMMRMLQMMRAQMAHEDMGGPMGMMGFEHVEGRIAFLRAELGITDAQQPQWNAFAEARRAQATTMRTMHEQMTRGGVPDSWPDRLARQERILSTRLDAVKAIEGPARALYATLSPEQQKRADDLLGRPRGGI
jgi:LTXXQ motif family protein